LDDVRRTKTRRLTEGIEENQAQIDTARYTKTGVASQTLSRRRLSEIGTAAKRQPSAKRVPYSSASPPRCLKADFSFAEFESGAAQGFSGGIQLTRPLLFLPQDRDEE
jgi:hypothetical protein